MWGKSILSILYLLVAVAYAVPAHYDSGDSAEDGIVYVFNLYAVRDTKTKHVAKMLNDDALIQIPAKFEPIGSMLLADTEEDEPFTMEEVSLFLERMGVTVEQLNDGDEPRVIEIKVDEDFDDFDIFQDFEETAKYLQDEGIILSMTLVNGSMIFSIEFDPAVKDADRHISLRDIGGVFEMEGYQVDYVTVGDSIKKVNIREPLPDDESKEILEHQTTKSSVEKKPERNENKIEKNEEKPKARKNELDEQFQMLDFTTRSEALNKIRRRRSSCPECKAVDILKAYVHEHERH
ncbi:uncharacterized protein LOC107037617 [Diachasma alloeum]|uniref:uncharacterized protein LOC107037617 n=1 Tax=Diachasma alloeum TaxID=454923 RepID=UPI0007384433|nr:uncharacterized protein LOC107037617 [Diachasma alloeum]